MKCSPLFVKITPTEWVNGIYFYTIHVKILSAEDMHDLLELAAEKRARRILEVAHRIGLKPTEIESATKRFDEELGGL